MKKTFLCALAALLFFLPVHLHAQAPDQETGAVLDAAEGLFKSMEGKDYQGIWQGLSQKSRNTIVAGTLKALKPTPLTETAVEDDFRQGKTLARAYWDAYLKKFDPAMALDQSRWEMGSIKGDRARILITHRKSQKAATLSMAKEDGRWRVCLAESFW